MKQQLQEDASTPELNALFAMLEAQKRKEQAIIASLSANILGLELAHEKSSIIEAILPSFDEGATARIQRFDANGPIGHSNFATPEKALEDAVGRGYVTPVPGAVDRLSSTPQWAQGVKRQGLRDRFNSGQISFEEMLRSMAALTEDSVH